MSIHLNKVHLDCIFSLLFLSPQPDKWEHFIIGSCIKSLIKSDLICSPTATAVTRPYFWNDICRLHNGQLTAIRQHKIQQITAECKRMSLLIQSFDIGSCLHLLTSRHDYSSHICILIKNWNIRQDGAQRSISRWQAAEEERRDDEARPCVRRVLTIC